VRLGVQGQLSALNADTLGGKVNFTFGQLIGRYLAEEFQNLRHSTQATNRSLIEMYIRPKWKDYRLREIKALGVPASGAKSDEAGQGQRLNEAAKKHHDHFAGQVSANCESAAGA
jgi:hypothetical protein